MNFIVDDFVKPYGTFSYFSISEVRVIRNHSIRLVYMFEGKHWNLRINFETIFNLRNWLMSEIEL